MPESSAHKTRGSETKCSVSSIGTRVAASAICATVLLRKSNDAAGACQPGTGNSVLLTWHGAHVSGELFGKVGPGSGPAWPSTVDTKASVVLVCMLWQVAQRGWRNLPASDWLNARVSTSCALTAARNTSAAPFVSVTVSRASGVPAPSASAAAAALAKASSTTSRCGVLPIAGITTPAASIETAGLVGTTPRSMPSGRFALVLDSGGLVPGRLLPSPDEQPPRAREATRDVKARVERAGMGRVGARAMRTGRRAYRGAAANGCSRRGLRADGKGRSERFGHGARPRAP